MIHKLRSLKNHAGFKKYFFNTGWLMADKVLRLFVGLLVGVWVARYLGPERFGILNYSISFVALFSAFAKLGLDQIVIRNIVQQPERQDEFIGTSLALRLAGSIMLLIIVYCALRLTSATAYEQMLVMIIAFGQVFMSMEVLDFYFQSQVQGKYSGLAGSMGIFFSALSRITCILLELSLEWFAGAVVIEQVVKAIFLLFFYFRKKLSIRQWKIRFIVVGNLLKDSWPLILSGLVIMLYMRIDQVMIKEMLGNEEVGQYAAAVRISEAWYFIPVVITQALFPAILSAKKQGERLYYYRLQQLYDLVFWIAIAVALPMTFISDFIIILLYGTEYHMSGMVLSIHIWAGIFVSLGVASSKWLISENLQIFLTVNTMIGAIINFILNIVLIKKLGVIGASWSTLISYFVAAYLCLSFWNTTRGHFIRLSKSILGLRFFYAKKNY